jgi:hypothetical protein
MIDIRYKTGNKLKGLKIRRLIFTTCIQSCGAPFIDQAFVTDDEGNRYKGIAILMFPWRRNKYGESQLQKAFVVGWQK